MTSTPTSACARRSPSSPARSCATRSRGEGPRAPAALWALQGPGWASDTGGSQGVWAPRGPGWALGSWGCPDGFGHRKVLGGFLLGPAFESDHGPARGRVIDSAGRGVREFSRVWRGLCPPQTLLLSDILSLMFPGGGGMMLVSVVGHRRGRWWQLSSSCCGSRMWGVGKGDMSPGKALDTPVSPQVCHPLDEANPEGPRPRHLHQTAGGGEGEEGQLRPRGEAPASPSLCPASLYVHNWSQFF